MPFASKEQRNAYMREYMAARRAAGMRESRPSRTLAEGVERSAGIRLDNKDLRYEIRRGGELIGYVESTHRRVESPAPEWCCYLHDEEPSRRRYESRAVATSVLLALASRV